MGLTQAQIDAKIPSRVITGGSQTRAVGIRELLNDITAGYLNKKDGGVVEAAVSYISEIALPDRKNFAYVGYVDDAVASVAVTASNGLTKVGNDIRMGGIFTGSTTIYGGNNSLNFGAPAGDPNPRLSFFNVWTSNEAVIRSGPGFSTSYVSVTPNEVEINANLGYLKLRANNSSFGVFITTSPVTTDTYLTIGDGDGTIATREYVDNLANGLKWKQSARAATIADTALSGLLTIDGVTLLANDRVLVKNQTNAAENGIYLASAGSWTRTSDAADANSIVGSTLMVAEGTVNENTQWHLSTDLPIIIGVTNLSFINLSGGLAYTAGAGLTLLGNQFSIPTDGITDTMISTHVSTKISITNKLQLNAGVVYNDQANTYGVFGQTFRSATLQLTNPANTFNYILTGSAIAANRAVTLPLLANADTFVFEDHTQALSNKTYNGMTVFATTATLALANGQTFNSTGAFNVGFTFTGITNVTVPLSGTLYSTLTNSMTSAQLATSLTDETGTGVNVFNTSPSFVTAVIGGATFAVFNTTSTTINAFGAATTMTIGGTPTTTITHNYSTNATASGNTKTVNLGTGGASGSTTNINIGSATSGSNSVLNLQGRLVWNAPGRTVIALPILQAITPGDTNLTLSTEAILNQFGGSSIQATVVRQWAAGALTLQRENLFVAPTYAFVAASVLATAATLSITAAPIAGTNATITDTLALLVQSGRSKFVGGLSAGLAVGTLQDASALVDLVSTTQGLGIMSMTTAQRDAIATPRNGLVVYKNDLIENFSGRINGVWKNLRLDFVEAYTTLSTPGAPNVWTVTTVTGAPANSIVEIMMQVTANAQRTMGVRAVGSALSRTGGVNGSDNSFTMVVKTNGASQIEMITNVVANSSFIYLGTLD